MYRGEWSGSVVAACVGAVVWEAVVCSVVVVAGGVVGMTVVVGGGEASEHAEKSSASTIKQVILRICAQCGTIVLPPDCIKNKISLAGMFARRQ